MLEQKNNVGLKETLDDFLGDIDDAKVEVSANLQIDPKLYIEGVGIENARQVKILSEAYGVEIPEDKSMSDDNKLKIIDVEYEGVKHQFIANAKSFRYQYAVIMKQLGYTKKQSARMIGAIVKIWLEWVELEKWGKQKLYKVSLISKPPK